MNFYSVIIGTELLNGRRRDEHFDFLNKELLKRGWEQRASFVIEDDPLFMNDVFDFIKKDNKSVMFSFGGIGATPDDYTRKIASEVFTDGNMEINKNAEKCILDKFGKESYPHRIEMANLPVKSSLLKNVISNIPGFYLEDRFFFMPGFPSMSQNMIIEALNKLYPKNINKTRLVLSAFCSEDVFIFVMKDISSNVDLSSLPTVENDRKYCVISISSIDDELCKIEFNKFIEFCKENNIKYILRDIYE